MTEHDQRQNETEEWANYGTELRGVREEEIRERRIKLTIGVMVIAALFAVSIVVFPTYWPYFLVLSLVFRIHQIWTY